MPSQKVKINGVWVDMGLGAAIDSSPTEGSIHAVSSGGVYTALQGKINKNIDIMASTKCKITYDAKGLVTSGSDLTSNDIPNLDASKITSGAIPDSRISSASIWNGKQSQHNTTTATLSSSGWSSNQQTVSVSGVTASNTVIISPAPASTTVWTESGIYCSAQTSDSLTFTCETVPTSNITVNVIIMN